MYFLNIYIYICFQLVAFVREHIWHKALLMGYLVRFELTLVHSLSVFVENLFGQFVKVLGTKTCFSEYITNFSQSFTWFALFSNQNVFDRPLFKPIALWIWIASKQVFLRGKNNFWCKSISNNTELIFIKKKKPEEKKIILSPNNSSCFVIDSRMFD